MNFDFGKAFKQGISSAEMTAKKNEEIKSVIDEASRQVKEATDGLISLSLENKIDGLAAFSNMFTNKGAVQDISKCHIMACNTVTGHKEELALWETAPTAYPCTISYSNLVEFCNDKESLEVQLAELLSHPDIGKKMFRLMKMKPSIPVIKPS